MNGILRDIRTFFQTIEQLRGLLTLKQQRQAIGVFLLIVAGAFFETLGIAAILPFISAVMSPSLLWGNKYIILFADKLNITDDIELIILLGVGISLIYVFKNLFLLFVTYVESMFRNNLTYEMSKLMLHSYLKRPYVYFLDTNSAEMMRGITDDINSVNEMTGAIFKICSLVLMIGGIGIFLATQDPVMTLGILILAVMIFLLIILIVKKETKRLGLLKREFAMKAYQYAYQAINGFKEITIMKREDYFLKSYTDITARKKKADITYTCILACPDRIVEAIFLSGIMLIICIQIASGRISETFIPNLAAFAVGAMRILPSLSTLTGRMEQLVYLRPALMGICNNVKAAKAHEQEIETRQRLIKSIEGNLGFNEKISVENIYWKYPNSNQYILENISMNIYKGDSIALVGKSGAGKTTLADILLGLLEPKEGKVLVDGVDIFSIPQIWCKIIGYVPQTVYLIDDTIRNNVSFGIWADEVDDAQIWSALEKAQIKEFVEQLPKQLDTVIGEQGIKFSGGQRQRIAIARALYHDPEILVFDEATAALDGETEQAVMEAIEALQGYKTLIIIAHRLNTVRHCNRFFEVGNQKVIEKRREEVFNNA